MHLEKDVLVLQKQKACCVIRTTS